jgi:endoglucanase Acf2
MKKRAVYGLVVVGLIAFAAFSVYVARMMDRPTTDTSGLPSLVNESTLKNLPQKDASGIDTSHLADGITPPTNKWFSGLALQQKPQRVFPTPLSFTPTENSFTVDFPSVTATDKTIAAATRQPLTAKISNATRYLVTRYDEVSVDLTFYSDDTKLGVLTLVAGLPYVYYHGLHDSTLMFDGSATVSNDTLSYKMKGATLAVSAYDGAKTEGQAITIPSGGLAVLYAGTDATIANTEQYAGNRVESVGVSYKKDGDSYRTTITYKTANGQPTYIGALPHQKTADGGPQLQTIYGALTMHSGTTLTFTTPTISVADTLDLSRLGDDEKSLLAQTVRQDINTPHTYPDDSYFGGKALYRDAQLLVLAQQLGEKEAVTTLQAQLRSGLAAWLGRDDSGAKSFYYDTKIKGIVGVTPSFGSEEFNDHHFHYGYFIYATSILARYDDDFRTQYGDMVNLLVADIANYRTNDPLPLRRSFDAYFGHSWASGSSPFADGNNQESSSEAINAWVATELWARQIGNAGLEDEAAWLLSNETAATSAYWMKYDKKTSPYSAGYGHDVLSLNWGGKRDYATFFSADPRAMLGIQLIPMSPTMQYMKSYGARIDEQLKETKTTDTPAQFDDYLLMYGALAGNKNALESAKQLPDKFIDDANSRSYLYAWIMSQ